MPAAMQATQLPASATTVPQHLAIIPDGNRRFARARGWDASRAYRVGAEKMLDVVGWCIARGVRRLSGFALSRENLRNRPPHEVTGVLRAVEYFAAEVARRHGLRPHVVGDLTALAPHPEAARLAALTGPPPPGRMALHVVVNHTPEQEREAPTAVPRVDLVIRPGGGHRLSGFLPLHCAYAELWFCDRLWPAFTEGDLDAALAWYRTQERTYGE